VKHSKAQTRARFHKIPALRFEDQRLTSYAGLIVFKPLFGLLALPARLKRCFAHLTPASVHGVHRVVLLLILQIVMGLPRLRDVRYAQGDPIVQRIVGLRKLPDPATISRTLAQLDATSVEQVRALSNGLVLERLEKAAFSRLDSAFFNEELLPIFERHGAEFSISVPFERFAELKAMIDARQRWYDGGGDWDYFETDWKPKKWDRRYRFIFVRKTVKRQIKGPLQLDLFEPRDFDFEYKAILTNKKQGAKAVLQYHNGRGGQEAIFGDAKQHAALAVIPTKLLAGNQLYTLCARMAHNLGRERQMLAAPAHKRPTAKRAAAWTFEKLDTIRHRIFQRAGRLTSPQGELTLTMSANKTAQKDLLHLLDAIEEPLRPATKLPPRFMQR